MLHSSSGLTCCIIPCQVIAESLSEEEIAGLKEMFRMIDTDNSGQITVEELKNGLERVGSVLKDSEITRLMQAVSACLQSKLAVLCTIVSCTKGPVTGCSLIRWNTIGKTLIHIAYEKQLYIKMNDHL